MDSQQRSVYNAAAGVQALYAARSTNHTTLHPFRVATTRAAGSRSSALVAVLALRIVFKDSALEAPPHTNAIWNTTHITHRKPVNSASVHAHSKKHHVHSKHC